MRQPGQGSKQQFENTTRKTKEKEKESRHQVGVTDPKSLKQTNRTNIQTNT